MQNRPEPNRHKARPGDVRQITRLTDGRLANKTVASCVLSPSSARNTVPNTTKSVFRSIVPGSVVIPQVDRVCEHSLQMDQISVQIHSESAINMKSWVMPMIFVLIALVFCQSAPAAEFGGYVTLTSDYVKRGVSQSDSGPAIQLSGDLSFDNGVFAGAWGSSVDIQNGPTRKRDLEINFYVGYVVDISATWRMSVGAVAYTYPGQTGNVDYDYEEFSVGAS